MVNYNNGKIYKIEPTVEHDEGDIYIGSTTKTLLSQRITAHRDDYKRWKNGKRGLTTSFFLFDKYGLEVCNIVLIENVENCKSINDLRSRESHYIRTLKCVNKNIPLRTCKEYREDNKEVIQEQNKEYRKNNKEKINLKDKQYCENNKEKIRQRHKQYREDHKEMAKAYAQQYYQNNKEHYNQYREDKKEEIKQYGLLYREKNKEKINQKDKQYCENNKEKIKQRRNQIKTCVCGINYTHCNKLRHESSNKHQTFLQNNPECIEL